MAIKQKKCKQCKQLFAPVKLLQSVCGFKCAGLYAIAQREKKEANLKRIERKKTKEALEAIKPTKELLKDASRWFNKYIKLRDAHLPCISCGRYEIGTDTWDCGHFRTVGSAKHMRFIEDNAHKQCSSCNRGSEKYIQKRELVAMAYEDNLRLRIGDERVDIIKRDNTQRHYTPDEARALKAKYKSLCYELENKEPSK